MKHMRCAFLSEFGIDQGLENGRFNTVGASYEGDFNKYWWEEMCRFEAYLTKAFPESAHDFVSGNTPFYKSFTIWPRQWPSLKKLFDVLLLYLEAEQPDASVVIANPFGTKLPVVRIVLCLNGAWADQDLAFQLLENPGYLDSTALDGQYSFSHVGDIREALPWLNQRPIAYEKSKRFWSLIYSNSGLIPIEENDDREIESYKLGGEIVKRLSQRYFNLNDNQKSDVYISSSLGTHKIIKVECIRKKASEKQFIDGVVQLVRGIDPDWAIRFTVFEDLTREDAYCGSMIVKPDGRLTIEVPE